jgi:multidrug resistance efflux pump
MVRRLKQRSVVAAGLLLTVLSAACVQLAPIIAPPRPGTGVIEAPADSTPVETGATAVATTVPPAAGRQTAPVRRGTIAELLPLSGRVAALDETAIQYPVAGRIDTVLVKPGDVVEQGQLLLQGDTTDIRRDLAAARSRLQLESLRMDQAQAQAQARQRQVEQKTEADQIRRQKAIADAEIGVRRATDDLARVKAGAPAADRRTAEAAVMSARAGVDRADAELARANAGPSDIELKTADQQVWSTRLALHRAETDFERLKQGPDPTELRTAQRDVDSAQTALDKARMDLERLVQGDPTAVAGAQREVQRAQLALRVAEATQVDSRGSKDAQRSARVARESAIASARMGLQDAQDRLNTTRRGPAPADVEMARRGIQSAASALQTARERYETVKKGPDEITLAAANQAVESARLAAQTAEGRYLEIKAGPPQDRVRAAQDAGRDARASLASAMERLADLNSRPTRAEVQDAEDRANAAQAALEQAQAEPEAAQDDSDPGAYDRLVLEKSLEQDRDQADSLERDMLAANLTAPFAGIVSAVLVRPGDPVDRSANVLSLARPGDPIVTVDVNGDDASRLAIGQRAVITLDGASDRDADASIVGFLDAPGGVGKIAQLKVAWPSPSPIFGTTAQAVVTLQEKADVLLVPQRAIRSSGQRRYVEYLDGESRRTADVALGISGALDVEVLAGLKEGQLVVVGTGGTAPNATPTAAPPAR